MTRPPRPEDPPGLPYSQRRPHMIPPEELTTHVGTCSHTFVSGLRRDADGEEPHLLPLDSSLLQPPQDVQEQGSEWLGVYLLAPHYKTISLAINPPERTMRSALDLLLSRAPDVPGTFFDSVVPLRPQRFQGVGSFVRFSSSVRNVGVGGQAVVALDLTRVGGHYFAAVLARELEFRTLMDYIVPLTSCGDEPLSVYIGYRTRPWPACAMVQLSDGEVITVLKEQYAASRPLKAEDLFNASTRWLFPRDVPELTYCEALYVLHQERRYLLPEHHHYGSTSVSFVADKLHLDPYKTVMCTFPIDDLDVQGTLARALVAVAEVPTPANTGVTREDAKDLFVLLDPRPFGLKPHFLFLHHEVVHLPTVIALLGLPTSRAHKVGVAGGEVQGNQIIVDGSSTLLLFPAARTEEELAEAASSSSDVSRLVSPWEEEEEAPQDDLQDADWGPPAGLTFAGVPVVDPSLPPGQSWNEGIDINVGDHLGVTAGDSGEPDPGTPVTSGRATTDTQPLQDPVGPLEDASPPSVSGLVELLQIQALVYVPDFVPEIVELELTIPATVPSLLACLQDARLAYQSSSFPDLFPAKPQIVPAFAIFVAAPLWQRGTSVVLFDCLMYDGTFFAKTVQRRLNRESLMLAAGLPHDAAVHVYVRGAVNHLGLGERLTIDNGDVIQIVRRGCAPGPRSHFNGYFLILNEGRPFPFQVAADRVEMSQQHHGQTILSTSQELRRAHCQMEIDLDLLTATDHPVTLATLIETVAVRPDSTDPDLLRTQRIYLLVPGQPLAGLEEEDDSQSDHMATGVSVEVTFYLLTPGYTPEKLELTVVLPQVVADVLDLVETCRDAARKVLYPSLIVVHPQPDPGWGILLALPTWVAHQTVICVDASLYDGRIFAIDASGATDFEALCELVGLAPTAEVDIFLPNSQQPLGRAEECMLRTGMCISLLRRGSARIGPFHLPAMLNSHLSWEHSPMFPRDTLGNGYCVAGPQGQILYRLHPERAFYYRSDIALLVGLHPFRTVVTPASPQPSDVCVRGWECRAVVAATDRDDQITWDGDVHPATVGLLDCRPLLLGWLPVSSREHWLELGPLRDALARHAPHGWQVVFPAFPAHWTWTCFAPGQVITVAYAPIARAALNTIRTGGFAHLDDDDDMPTDDQVSESEDTSWPGATGQVSDHTVDHAPGHLHGLSRVNWFWRTVHLFAACCALSLMPHVPEPALVPGAFALCVLATPGATAPQRPHWWRALKERFDRFCHGSIPFILGDFNMHFAEDVPGHVGDKVFPSRHEVPEAFLELIRQYELWIPSTFSQCHPGDHATWFPPTGGPGSRLDYVLISKEWHVGANESQVFSALDWGQPRVDHLALRTYVHFRSTGSVETRAHRPMYDREAMLTLEGKSRLEEIFSAVPAQPWATNVHEHYAGVQRYLVGALELAFPTAKKCCRSSHFSASTWQLRQRRVWLRRQVTRLGKISQIVDQKCAFLCLRLRLRIQVGSWVYALRHGRVIHTLASYVAELRDTKKTLRQSIRHDVGTRIQSAATSAESTSTGNVVSRLQCLLGPSARKTRPPRRLPSLTRADGSPALEPLEVEEAWVEHFSGIEDGCRRSPEDLVAACLHTQRSRDLDDMDIGPMDLPTQADLETAFRDTTLHRAYGIDGVPVEALHSAPGAAARAMFPVILKCALRLEEPLHFKGGSLYAVWKGKSSPGLCSSYRGILVSSTIGKAYHRLIRTRNIPALKEASTPLQIGGLPKCPVTLAAQVVRLHQNWCRKAGISQATLFLDLREAFYRIVRPLVTGFRGTDEDIARIVSSVHLPPGVMHELRAHLEDKSLLEQSGATQWAATAACEALHHTWFRFEHGKTVTETNIGTRPGDNLADLVFSFVFARVLHQVREVAEAQASLSVLPWHSDMLNNVLDDLPAATETVPLLDCTWMDDSAFVVCHADASTLVGNLRLISGALLDSCLGRAMLPNLDRGKTEAVLSLVGRGSRKLRADLFRRDPPVLEAPCQLWPGANVRLVSQYKHLGGLIHHTGSLLREVKCRVALAWGAFNRRRKRIFASPVVDRGDKVQLFDSLVISVLLHGAGTWTEVGTDELRHLSAAYHHMVATMLRPQYRLEEAKHLGSSQILSLARLPSVEVLLHLARLRPAPGDPAGQGSRAAEDAGASQDRPVAEILDCLLCIGRDGTEVTRQALWQQVKIAFSCVCAETGRLRHTADTFLSLLPGLQDLLDSVRSDLGDVISWVMQADVVEWLVPAPDCAPPVGNTFQDCESVLGMMEVAHLLFPASPCSTPDCIRLLVGPESWCRIQEATFPNSVTFTLDECISLSSTGTTPSFFEGPYDGVVCHLCVDTWNGFGDPPPPHVPAKAFEAHLVREVLCGDIARLALRLWGLGVPTCLLFPAHVSSAISPIHEVGALEQGTAHDLCLLRNKWPYW
ncbi:hypothetical protein AK812_SmicGene16718 [Symbiodinium microadriaticum]|uniref:Uncharacterized protein n=1 Tax=Symbiodinium microadriaticum TaxID=2951 RepID=A0A1Q9DZK9_SYMMI|nr:hypothetical protein AK812_SmicGene16718 [Symbiodinium microadriaticum]CAE7777849.1 unnamed protein product [Symbiodinium microadriaticum]CAE7906208.1 unnamed protein product [Symbiodinium sp. KB8]